MAAGKDNGEEPPADSRRAVIWRLPATAGTTESTDAPDAPDAEADRPKDRRVPLPVVWGLVAALVCVGLYAAWSEFGSDILGTSGEPDAAAASASATPSAAEQPGAGATGGEASASPPVAGESAPVVTAEDEAGEDAEAGVETGLVEEAAPVVAAPQGDEAAPQEGPAPESPLPAADPPSPTPAIAADEPQTTPAAESARDEVLAAPDTSAVTTAEAPAEAPAEAVPGPETRTQSPAPARIGDEALGALSARLDVLETGSRGAINAGTAVIALEQRVRALEDDPTREPLGQALAAWGEQRAALEAALAEVSARLARFEAEATQQAAADGRLVTLVLATGELSAALGSSRPFAPALDALRGIAGEDPEIESALVRLTPFAATGVPTLDGLSARFPEAANAIVRTTPAIEDSDWIDETVTKLSQLVTIRRTGGAIDAESLDGRLVEAETALNAGDLGRAIAIVGALMPAGAEAGIAKPWLRDARARAEADDALAGLGAIVHARIGARWAATGAAP